MDLTKLYIRGKSFLYKREIYVVKSSEKEENNKSGLYLLFNRANFIFKEKHKCDAKVIKGSKPNRWHLHLTWLLTVGELLKTTEFCPYCPSGKRNIIKWFALRPDAEGRHRYGLPFVCCDCESCMREIDTDFKTILLPFKISSLRDLSESNQKRMGNFFKEIFLGKGRFDSKKAFELFLSHTPGPLINHMGD